MTDDNSTDPGIQVNASPYVDMAASAVRSLVLVVSALVALAGFVSKHDWAGVITYVQSAPFLTALATVMAAGAFVWGQIKTRRRAVDLSAVAQSPKVPDTVAKLKE